MNEQARYESRLGFDDDLNEVETAKKSRKAPMKKQNSVVLRAVAN